MKSFACRWFFGVSGLLAIASTSACSASSDGDTGFGGAGDGATNGSTTGSSTGGQGGNDISVGSGVGGGGGAGGGSCVQAIDIVFVMDVSTSMGGFLSKLAQEMPVVDDAVKKLNLATPPHYGLVVFVDDMLFANGAKAYPDVAALQSEFQTWASFTSTNTQVSGTGYNSTFPENSLDGIFAAATQFEWRPIDETLRIIIHTTDDTFWEGPAMQDGVQIVHDYKGTVAALQQAKVRDFSFAAMLGGPDEVDDVSAGWFKDYAGNKSIPESTGGGVFKLDDVLSGSISLSASINQAVTDSLCEPYPTPR